MNETTNNKRKIAAAAVVIIAIAFLAIGAGALRGDDKTNDTQVGNTSVSSPETNESTATQSTGSTGTSAAYKDGSYSAEADYQTPGGREGITVKISVSDGTVTTSEVSFNTNDRESEEYQDQFAANYKSQVVGKKLSDINLSVVSGSSLTSAGFNEALDAIKTQASAQS